MTFRTVPLAGVAVIRAALAEQGVHPARRGRDHPDPGGPGAAVCSLGTTDSPGAGRALADTSALRRNGALQVSVSGCPDSCAQHQVGDIGLAGARCGSRAW